MGWNSELSTEGAVTEPFESSNCSEPVTLHGGALGGVPGAR